MLATQQLSSFLQRKASYGADIGFKPYHIPDTAFDFQKFLSDWIIRKGRGAVFADCGMGKTLIQLTWADNVVRHTNRPVLMLTPLAVGRQTMAEAHKFGFDAKIAIPGETPAKTIHITNYEKLHLFNPHDYAGVVGDESSIIKNNIGVTSVAVIEFFRVIKYRALFTATAAPNDWDELGTSSEALGYYGHTDMLSKFFTNKNKSVSARRFKNSKDKHFLRAHSEQHFWRWIASWARAARMPSDIGFDNGGFVLPQLIENDIEVSAERPPDGMLWEMEAINWHEEREAIRRTTPERCEKAAEQVAQHDISFVMCHTNAEAEYLRKIIPNSVEISGSDSDEKKEEAADWFINGSDSRRVLISKPRIFGFGMNFQHCRHAVYFPTHSYEQYYQATRRLWRFGQARPVVIDRIFTNGGRRMLDNMDRKSRQAAKMFEQMVEYMNDELYLKDNYQPKKIGVPQWLTK